MNGNMIFHFQNNHLGNLLPLSSKKILFRLGLYQTIVFLLFFPLFTDADKYVHPDSGVDSSFNIIKY
jgi:hypothetical protein